ncbi:MAG TPA: hypothetical protein VF101_11425 [Gaiellaceae bacterium]
MSEHRYSRRRFLRTAGGGVVGVSAAAALGVAVAEATSEGAPKLGRPPVTGVPFSPNPPDVVAGFLQSADVGRRTAVLQTAEQGRINVAFTNDALLWRDHRVGLNAFTPGEELVAEGTWADGVFSAFSLITIYQSLYATVTGVSGDRVFTSGGTLRFVPETRHQHGDELLPARAAEARLATQVGAIVRYVPRDREYVVLRVL